MSPARGTMAQRSAEAARLNVLSSLRQPLPGLATLRYAVQPAQAVGSDE